jgi:hypothetical protein
MAEEVSYVDVMNDVLEGGLSRIREETKFKNAELREVEKGVKTIVPKPSILGEKARDREDKWRDLHEVTVKCGVDRCSVEGHFTAPGDMGEMLSESINSIKRCAAGLSASPFPPDVRNPVVNVSFTCDAATPVDAASQSFNVVKKLEECEDEERKLRSTLETRYGKDYASILRLRMMKKRLRKLGFI